MLSFNVLDRVQHYLLFLCEIFAFSTTSHFSYQETLHIKRRNTVRKIDLPDSFSWLVVSGKINLSGAIFLFLSLKAEVADLDLTVGAGSLFFMYSLPFRSLFYSAEFSLILISVRASQFLVRHNPGNLFSPVIYLVKELQVCIAVRNFRSIDSQAFKLTSMQGSPGRIRTRYFLEEHKTTVLVY